MGTLGKDRPMAVRTELRRIVSEGMYRYLLSDFEYGTRTFKINARIEFVELCGRRVRSMQVSFLDGTLQRKSHGIFSLFSGRRLLLEQNRSVPAETNTTTFVTSMKAFRFFFRQSYEISLDATEEVIAVSIDRREVHSVRPPKGALTGKVGLRRRSVLKCDRFEVSCRLYLNRRLWPVTALKS